MRNSLIVLITACCLVNAVSAVKFDLMAQPVQVIQSVPSNVQQQLKHATPSTMGKRCLTFFVGSDVLVTGLIKVSPGFHMQVDVEITDSSGGSFWVKKNIEEVAKFSFKTHKEPRDYDLCVVNILSEGYAPAPTLKRTVEVQVEAGYDLFDDDVDARQQKLKPMEQELRKMEGVMATLVDELEYMKQREARFRDTNESTNDRVKILSALSILTLIGSGCWQIFYLKRFFASKRLI